MTIRDATAEDAPHLADIVIACWRHAYRGVLPDEVLDRDDRDVRTARIRARLADGWPTFVAEVGTRVVGFARLMVAPRVCDAEIEGLFVEPAAGRAGVGRALVRHACTHLAARGMRTLYIHTLRDNRIGRAFYDKLGGRVVVEDTWSFAGASYPAVGYRWDDLRALIA